MAAFAAQTVVGSDFTLTGQQQRCYHNSGDVWANNPES